MRPGNEAKSTVARSQIVREKYFRCSISGADEVVEIFATRIKAPSGKDSILHSSYSSARVKCNFFFWRCNSNVYGTGPTRRLIEARRLFAGPRLFEGGVYSRKYGSRDLGDDDCRQHQAGDVL